MAKVVLGKLRVSTAIDHTNTSTRSFKWILKDFPQVQDMIAGGDAYIVGELRIDGRSGNVRQLIRVEPLTFLVGHVVDFTATFRYKVVRRRVGNRCADNDLLLNVIINVVTDKEEEKILTKLANIVHGCHVKRGGRDGKRRRTTDYVIEWNRSEGEERAVREFGGLMRVGGLCQTRPSHARHAVCARRMMTGEGPGSSSSSSGTGSRTRHVWWLAMGLFLGGACSHISLHDGVCLCCGIFFRQVITCFTDRQVRC